jgi:PHP family Zn ribbon phosphoesterase
MNIIQMASWAKKKGIGLLGTGDFTHPVYFKDLKKKLKPAGNSLYTSKSEPSVFFMLTAEVSSIYSCKGKVRKNHNIIMAPSLKTAEKINNTLSRHGNLSSDGRPILGTPSKEMLKMVLDISEDCLFVPAHVWTPWFSMFGSKSGFDSIEECFDECSGYIYAIETGLSSDPEMNWRLSALDNITLLSNSDAHSPSKLGREANVFNCEMDYHTILNIIKEKDITRFLCTIEFFCNKRLTVGVLSRVNELADRPEGFIPENAIPSKHLVPLQEIIAAALQQGVNTKKVREEYEKLMSLYTEFEILLDLPEYELYRITQGRIAEGVLRVRTGNIHITPGFDGVYGRVSIFRQPPKGCAGREL